MANIRGVLANIIDIPSGDGDSYTTGIVNQKIPNTSPLEVNQSITNLIALSDNLGSGEGSVEDGSEPYSYYPFGNTNDYFEGDRGTNYGIHIVMNFDVIPSSPARPSIDLEPAEVDRDKQRTSYFINSFIEVNDRNLNDMELRITSASKDIPRFITNIIFFMTVGKTWFERSAKVCCRMLMLLNTIRWKRNQWDNLLFQQRSQFGGYLYIRGAVF